MDSMKRTAAVLAAVAAALCLRLSPAFAEAPADMAASAAFDAGSYGEGDAATLKCVVKNASASPIEASASLSLSGGLAFAQGQAARIDLGELSAGESRELEFALVAAVAAGAAGGNSPKAGGDMAEGTGGKYYRARAGLDLDDIFKDIEGETADLVADSNGNGIPDYYSDRIKDGTLLLSNGSRQFAGIDFNCVHTGKHVHSRSTFRASWRRL